MNSTLAGADAPDDDPRRYTSLLPPHLLALSELRVQQQLAGIDPPRKPSHNEPRKNRYDFVLLLVANMFGYFFATAHLNSTPQEAFLTIGALNLISWAVIHGNIGPTLKRMLTALSR